MPPEILYLIIFALVLVIFYLLSKKSPKNDDNSLRLIQQQILHLNKSLDAKLSENSRNNLKQAEINSSISREATKKIEEITKKLSSLEETNKQIKDIGGQLEGLENILKNPKQRGILGEYFLENVLKNILPPENYKTQYKFQTGEIVDAVIFVKDKIIPIDSKFSLENYNKILEEEDVIQKEIFIKEFRNDLKKRIDETSKYIKPEEKTMDFAFMFIPSEGVYYDLIVNKVGAIQSKTTDLIEYAFKEKKVIIVSPTSFYAYLQTVLQGLRALIIEEKATEIVKKVNSLKKYLDDYELLFEKVGNSLNTTVNHYNNSYKKFNQIEKNILKISESEDLEEVKRIEVGKVNRE
ncbi:DNA recombination protein RmuC [Candidatus Gracilibacteria bacterium]|nr:MAG: DNA recombination protein RmuC [Candidatus Gracilibacteria bacterium]